MTPDEYGDKLIALGTALKSKDSTLRDIAMMAFDIGLVFQTRMVPLSEAEGDKP